MHTASKRWRVCVLALLAGLVIAVAGVAAGCGSTKSVTKTVTVTSASKSEAPTKLLYVRLPPAAPAGQMVIYVHIKSLARKSGLRVQLSKTGQPRLGRAFRTTTASSMRATGC
jgi:hypothetical protein